MYKPNERTDLSKMKLMIKSAQMPLLKKNTAYFRPKIYMQKIVSLGIQQSKLTSQTSRA